MLTADLVRAQVRAGILRPRWVKLADPDRLDDARAVLGLFEAHVGDRVGLLDEALDDLAASRTDVLFIRGLAKLCMDRAELAIFTLTAPDQTPIAPSALRTALFTAAAARWPVRPGGHSGFTSRETLLAEVAATWQLAPADLDRALYADRRSEQLIQSFRTLSPESLLQRYHLALAQGCLLRAREVRVHLEGDAKRMRAVLRELKFRRLLFRATPHAHGLDLVLDGPLSLFRQTSRYGLALALALPAFVRCPRWTLEAAVTWGPTRRDATFRLDDTAPLTASGKDPGTWVSAEEEHFERAFAALASPWTLTRDPDLIDLDGQDILIPDLVAIHPDGRKAAIELVFSWRQATLQGRLALLARHAPPNLLIVIAEKGALDDTTLAKLDATRLTLIPMKGVVPARLILTALDALPPASSSPHKRSSS